MSRNEQSTSVDAPDQFGAVMAVGTIVVALLIAAAATWLPVGGVLGRDVVGTVSAVQQVAPQGWAFFTKSPRSEVYYAYAASSSGTWEPANRGPNAQPKYLFGLNRESRLTEFDVQTLVAEAEKSWWTECPSSSNDQECLDRAASHSIAVSGYDLRLCGEVGLLRREPVPWAYRDFYEKSSGSSLRLTVECKEVAQ